jgi:ADP-ribose pyrophosphatase YjhB (NUDIX family)
MKGKPKVQIADEVTDLKRGVDHIGVCAVAVIHDGQGNILLMKRGQKARDERGRWDICGGAIEFGEPTQEALAREVSEELCTEPEEITFITAYDAHREHEGKKTHWVALVHAVKVDPTQVDIGEPHKIEEIGWFNSSNLPEPRHSQFERSFSHARKIGIVD